MHTRRFSLLLFCGLSVFGARPRAENLSTSQIIRGGLASIEQSQKKNDPLYFDGEWSAEMTSYLLPAVLGVAHFWARPVQEPTAFVSASMAKTLHEIHLYMPTDSSLSRMANEALASTVPYRTGTSYGYYSPAYVNGVKVRGPRADHYVPNYIRGLTHVPPDTDTTSATFAAFLMWHPEIPVPAETFVTLSKYRDLNRHAHYHNFFMGMKNTGAFLTWQINEKDPAMPRGIFAPPEDGERIPFRMNDVDCIVNGNALHFLTLAKQFHLPGYQQSCDMLNSMVLRGQQRSCGIYYPNVYALFFTNSNAYKDGASCLEVSRQASIKYLLSNQSPDGFWSNEPGIGRSDLVHSTALAMTALMNYQDPKKPLDPGIAYSLAAGAKYLKSQALCETSGECSWRGEVFFSAVSQARNTVLWRSTPYTTALATLALVKARALKVTEP